MHMKDYLDEYIVATRLIFRPEGVTIDQLAEALGKTPRAVFSILNQLDNMFPLYTDQDPKNPKNLDTKQTALLQNTFLILSSLKRTKLFSTI